MTPLKAVGYIRVSTEEQAESGLGLEAQRQRIVAFATARGFELVNIYEDAGFSAGTMNRPAMQDLQEDVRNQDPKAKTIEAVIVLKIDRLTRRIRDMLDFVDWTKEQGIAFCAVEEQFDTTTAMGQFVLNVMASVAQLERDQISERTKKAVQAGRDKGRRMGTDGNSFGFRMIPKGGVMVVPSELEIVDLVFQLRYIEGYSTNQIARYIELNEIKHSTNRMTIWRRTKNGMYLSVISHEAREAAMQAGVEPVPLPIDSSLTYDPELLKGDDRD